MKEKVSAKGYTNVILVLNMKRFIASEDLAKFENVRGTPQYAEVLRNGWWHSAKKSRPFVNMVDEKRNHSPENHMSTEEVGFATGVFRSFFLEEHVVPTYILRKENVKFSPDLKDNFQFRALFMRAWKAWKIYIRLTVTGMMIIRLTREYTTPRELIRVAEDVLHLQESLDVQSARAWLIKRKEELRNQPDEFKKVKKSVEAFLKWLGSKSSEKGDLLYNPVQWKIAMEVGTLFVKTVGEIPMPDSEPIHLCPPTPRLSIPLHDSYVIFHVDELYADETIVIKQDTSNKSVHKNRKSKEKVSVRQIPVLPEDLPRSPLIKRALLNLLEGAILEHEPGVPKDGAIPRENSLYFPALRWQNIEHILENNLASWMEEICLLTSRTALIVPSRKYKRDYLLVSTTPGATLKVKYARYWGAIERMIEFTVETRTLAQLVERASFDALNQLAKAVARARETLHSGDVELDHIELPALVRNANNVRRLAGMSQSLSDPLVWSRSEYAILKAQYLLDALGVPTLLGHIENNISSLNSGVDHVDEFYALDLAEKENDLSVVLSVGLAAVSLIFTLMSLPSFWASIRLINFDGKPIPELVFLGLLKVLSYLGLGFGVSLFVISFLLILQAARRGKKIWYVLQHSLIRLGR